MSCRESPVTFAGRVAMFGAILFLVAGCTPRWAREVAATKDQAAGVHACPGCKRESRPTGQTKSEWAQRYELYRCDEGHEEWVAVHSERHVEQAVVSDPCPSCGRQLTWTGQTNGFGEFETEVFACEAGHSVTRRK